MIVGRAELAHDLYLSIHHHLFPVFGRKVIDHLFDALGRAGAAFDQQLRLEDPHTGFMVKPEQQAFGRKAGVGKLGIAEGIEQRLGLGPVVILYKVGISHIVVFEVPVTGKIGHGGAAVLRQMLEQDAASAP